MTDKEKRELKDGVISIFKRFNILDHAATIGGLKDDILRYINFLQEEPVSKQKLSNVERTVKNWKEPVSEDLEDAASSFARKDSEGISNPANFYYTIADKARIFKAGVKWQMAQMIKDATEVTVHIDAGGYPYIPRIELYNYDKDVPLAMEGDRYKVILIKEE